MIVALARQDGRDAVFDAPQQVLRVGAADPEIAVTLTGDPSVVAHGRVREVVAAGRPGDPHLRGQGRA